MTQLSEVIENSIKAEMMPALPAWEVGKTYWTRGSMGHRCRVLIVSTRLRAAKPIAGILIKSDDEEDSVWQWGAGGAFNENDEGSTLDLTTDEAPL